MKNRVRQLFNILEIEGKATRKNPQRMRVYDTKGIAPTIYTYQGGNLEPFILELIDSEI